MASFYAELQVAGHVYPVRHCTYSFSQATDSRGRVVAKVRHGLIELVLDVPANNFLEHWATTAYQPLAGRVVFFAGAGGAALETLFWEAGHCVGYRETFDDGQGDGGAASYVCFVTLVAPKLAMLPGAPAAYVSPAARDHGQPQQGLVNPFVVPLLTPTPVAVPLAEAAAEVMLEAAAATVLAPVALILAIILGTATPAGGPGIPQYPKSPVGRDELRLRELVAKHAAGTLAPGEEAELIALLGSVKGIHVQRLEDLHVQAPLRGNAVSLPGFHNIPLTYTKKSEADLVTVRNKFNSSARKNFLKYIGTEPHNIAQLRQAGFSNDDIEELAKGIQPPDYQVHHKLPLDDGGDNSFSNLVLIKNDPYHKALTNLQNRATRGLQTGQTRVIQWPVCPGIIYPSK